MLRMTVESANIEVDVAARICGLVAILLLVRIVTMMKISQVCTNNID